MITINEKDVRRLVRIFSTVRSQLTQKQFDDLKLLYETPGGIRISRLPGNQRVIGDTVRSCSLIGTAMIKAMGERPVKHSMMVLGTLTKRRGYWLMLDNVREALNRLGWFDDLVMADRSTLEVSWSRDELILALDLYLRFRASPPGKHSEEVIELSELLNQMRRVLGQPANTMYRNPNDVYMKLMNFRRFDTTYTSDGKVGLMRGNQDEELVWNEFSGNCARLQDVVSAIRLAVEDVHSGELVGMDEPDICEAEEGKVLTRLHRVRERNRSLVEKCKEAALKRHGRLFCEACGFDFSIKYGEMGNGIIDVHHKKPVHTLKPGGTTKLQDLALLCTNCHRVVHSRRRWLSVDEVKAAIQQ